VVIVRYPPRSDRAQLNRWIVVGVDDRPGNDGLVTHAIEEARLRGTAVLAVATWSSRLTGVSYTEVDARCQAWSQRYPGVHIRPAAAGGGLPEFLVSIRDRDVELVVIGAADADQIPHIIGPHHRPLVPSRQSSVMVVR